MVRETTSVRALSLPVLQDGEGRSEVIISWDDSPAIQVEHLPPPPLVAGVAPRPESLTYQGKAIYTVANGEWFEQLHRNLTRLAAAALRRHRAAGVMSGLTLGWETALAEAALDLRLPLTVILGFKGVQSNWSLEHRQRFGRLLGKADQTAILFGGGYEPWKLRKSRERVVSRSDLLLTLWDGEDLQVREAITFARTRGLQIVNLWQSWVRYGGMVRP